MLPRCWQAAASAIFHAVPGGHVLIPDDIYHGIRTVLQTVFADWGLGYTEVNMSDLAEVEAALEASRRFDQVVVWLETPSNPLVKVTDIAAVAEMAHATPGRTVVVDSTWVTPLVTRPLDLGADMVLHSVTKYLGGHSDLTGGCVVGAESVAGEGGLMARVRHGQTFVGGGLAPFDCWLALRGVRSLGARMPVHSKNALELAKFLEAHPRVTHTHYPGLESHPGHEVAARQMMGGFSGMLSFQVEGGEAAALALAARLQIFRRATSLGGTESLVEHRASIEPEDTPTPRDLLRLSAGLEDAGDLIADLAQALE